MRSATVQTFERRAMKKERDRDRLRFDLHAAECDVRCDCGSLLARWTAAGLELKCRRCKRRIVVPLSERGPPGEPS
jgi:hypothetical protein